jgi:hypothetical protein
LDLVCILFHLSINRYLDDSQTAQGASRLAPRSVTASLGKRIPFNPGGIVSLLAALLFFIPGFMSTVWPWKVTSTLAQLYAGPLLSYGLGSLFFSRQEKWLGIKAIVPGMFAFAVTTVIVSLIHVTLFSFAELADLIWFGLFGVAVVILGVLTVRVIRARA